jgi:hypothetical protein
MVFNATFNNISVISWRSDLLMEETIYLSQVTDKLSHNVHLAWTRFVLVVIGTDCIDSYKSNYHTITTMTAPNIKRSKLDKPNMISYSWLGTDTSIKICKVKLVLLSQTCPLHEMVQLWECLTRIWYITEVCYSEGIFYVLQKLFLILVKYKNISKGASFMSCLILVYFVIIIPIICFHLYAKLCIHDCPYDLLLTFIYFVLQKSLHVWCRRMILFTINKS